MIKIEDLINVKRIDEIEGLEIKKYVSVLTKTIMIEALVDKLVRKDKNDMYIVNSIEKEVMKKVGAVSLYTNIELGENDYLNYDILQQNNLFEQINDECNKYSIMDCHGSDIEHFYKMLDDRINDKLEENNINRLIADGTNKVIDIIDDTMEHVNNMLDKGDPNVIAKYVTDVLNKLVKKIPDTTTQDMIEMIKGLRK